MTVHRQVPQHLLERPCLEPARQSQESLALEVSIYRKGVKRLKRRKEGKAEPQACRTEKRALERWKDHRMLPTTDPC